MSSPNAKNIVELRQLLAAKFPGVRHSAERRESMAPRVPTGVPAIDAQLDGGLPKGAITEVTSSGISCGTALFFNSLLHEAHGRGEWVALVDGCDAFDPGTVPAEALSRLIWVRSSDAKDAVKATDILVHDGSVGIVVVDLLFCPAAQLRKIPSSTWFRLQRILENNATALVVMAAEHMVSNADAQVRLQKRFGLDALARARETLLVQIAPEVPETINKRIVKSA